MSDKKTETAFAVPDKQNLSQLNDSVNFDPDKQVEMATKAANALMKIINQKPKKVVMNGETYIEFEDWQTIAQFYGHTVGIESTKPIIVGGKTFGWEAKAVVYNRDGLVVGGAENSCLRDEPNWSSKPDFQLRSMAQTRAMAKALRSRFGFVAVLAGYKATPAEEMDVPSNQTGTTNSTRSSTNIPISKAQEDLILKLAKDKGIGKADMIDQGFDPEKLTGGRGGTASELIDWLLKAKSKIVNGQPVEELPIIEQEVLEEADKEIA